jgi:hypothetical protein
MIGEIGAAARADDNRHHVFRQIFPELRGFLPTELVGFLLYFKVADRGLGWVQLCNFDQALPALVEIGFERLSFSAGWPGWRFAVRFVSEDPGSEKQQQGGSSNVERQPRFGFHFTWNDSMSSVNGPLRVCVSPRAWRQSVGLYVKEPGTLERKWSFRQMGLVGRLHSINLLHKTERLLRENRARLIAASQARSAA